MDVTVVPGSPLKGVADIPGDKSLSHRAALLAAIANGDSRIENFQDSGVTRAMLDAVAALGVPWKLDGKTLRIKGRGIEGLKTPHNPIVCGNSATTLRLLTGVLAAAGLEATLDGSDGLRKRPMKRIIEPLEKMGVPIQSSLGGTAPLKLAARGPGNQLKALDYNLPVASAQVKSCLLLAALAADGVTTLREPQLSRDHTERMLSSMGVMCSSQEMKLENDVFYETQLTPAYPLVLAPLNLSLPGDFSAAAFLIIAALITPGSNINIPWVGLNPTRTGLLEALNQMGARIEVTNPGESAGEPLGSLTVYSSELRGMDVGGGLVVRMIDEFPIFAVAAAYAHGTTVVKDATELRYKESDRIGKLCAELVHLGVGITETLDGFIIQGGKALEGGRVQSFGDHRLAMALMTAGLGARKSVIVEDAEVISESFPEFSNVLLHLGAGLKIEE